MDDERAQAAEDAVGARDERGGRRARASGAGSVKRTVAGLTPDPEPDVHACAAARGSGIVGA